MSEVEPEYEYVKGQGWVIVTCPRETFILGNYVVTLEERCARPGERGWSGVFRGNVEAVKASSYWQGVFTRDPSSYITEIETQHRYRADQKYTVCTWKEI